MSDKKLEIMIVHESIKESIISDSYTVGSLIACAYIGYLLDSSALQWFAGLFLVLMIITRSASRSITGPRLTIQQARQKLDELEREFAQG